ncbi:MAG: ester cyclase [Candidatus Dormibacterales bacterium]
MADQDAMQIAQHGVEAFNAGDWGGLSADLTMDSVYEEPATGRAVKGIEEILAANRGWKAAFPDANGTITNALTCGDTAVIEITWKGTQTGELVGPMGTIPPTGRRITLKAVQVVEAERGKSKSTRHYFDLAGMLVQLGVAPARA